MADRVVQLQLGEKFGPLFQPFRYKALFGGRGSAKSRSISLALSVLSSQKPMRIVCGRQFQNSIRDSAKSTIEGRIKELGLQRDYNVTHNEIVHRRLDSRFTFVGLERNIDSIKSLDDVDIFWIEEARNVKQRSWELLVPTIRKPGSEIWCSWNPVSPEDPIDEYFRGAFPPKDAYIQRVGIEDNPWFYQTQMPDDMERMRRSNLKRFNHVWMGEYDELNESRVFTNWRVGRLNTTEYDMPRFGMDFGFSRDPSALVKLYVLERTRQIYIAQEMFGHIPLDDMPAAMDEVSESRRYPITADSSQPMTIDFLNKRRFNVRGSVKGPGSVKSGVNWLQGYEIVIDPECVHMQEEARLYSWKVDPLSQKPLPVLEDMDNHGWDAVRYATEDLRQNNAVGMKRIQL
jgi:phage terminase large subunit